jgi:hypothetical protein
MPRKIALTLAWVGATVVSVVIASAAVGTVRNNVSDTPSPLRTASETFVTATSTTTDSGSGERGSAPTASSAATVTVPTSTASTLPTSTVTTTTSPAAIATSPPASAPPTTGPTSTTAAAPIPEVTSYPQVGGTTTIRTDGTGVHLVGSVPSSGFQVDVEKSGPREVEVRYRSEDHTSKFKAEWEDGQLHIEVSESDSDDD